MHTFQHTSYIIAHLFNTLITFMHTLNTLVIFFQASENFEFCTVCTFKATFLESEIVENFSINKVRCCLLKLNTN